ncbi:MULTISPECIES: WD40 repeat domain-containing protein [Streptomyces]|uniref:WD40 repeat domain-containing protein n=1 Tax=Streptomyces TaxID=1883 RepID=UPI000BEFDA26|nr:MULTISPECIES: WD40 repeat domain-containing protein [Streptomyces]MCX4519481.1 WD40 repeat domain-containing protein [Streptomyces anulatus]MCX4602362.1 WD40 repeat domain-containing protein [Streptomyces anulatus]WTE27334.1 WD40 repeat domain-containing protein [Streptomyces anulatus]
MKLSPSPIAATLPNSSPVASLAISPNSEEVMIGQTADATNPALSRWRVSDFSSVPGPTPCPMAAGTDSCSSLSWILEDELVAVSLSGQQLTVINLTDGTWSAPVEGRVVRASVKGSLLSTSGARTQIHDAATGRTVWQQAPSAPPAKNNPSRVPVVTFHPSEETFAVGGTGEPVISVHSLDGSSAVKRMVGAPPRLQGLSYGPQGMYLVALDAAARSTVVWRTEEAEPHLPEIFGEEAEQYCSVAFHPDGMHCAMGMLSGYIDVYRLLDGAMVDSRKGHSMRVQALSFTSDGSLLLSGGDDGKLLAWPVIQA